MLIDVKRATLLVVDVQDKLLPAIDQHEALQESLLRLVGAAVDAGLPVVFSEQYPQGLGGTTPALLALAPEAPVVEKVHFSCVAGDCLPESLWQRDQVVVCGAETHVCVLQTVLELLEAGKRVFLVRDAVGSRSALDRETGLLRMQQAGATLVTREMVLFETLRQAGTDLFRHMSRRYLIEDAPLANSRVFDALRQSQVRGKCFADILALLPRPHGALRLRGICGTEADVLLDDLPGQSGSWKVYGYLLRHFDGQVGKDAAQAGLVLYAEHVADAREHPGKHPNIDRLLAIVAGRGAVLGCA